MTNFVDFELDPDCKTFHKLGTGLELDWVNGKEQRNFCHQKSVFY